MYRVVEEEVGKKEQYISYNNDHNLLNYSTHMRQSENTGDFPIHTLL